jgi:hypothetical protein
LIIEPQFYIGQNGYLSDTETSAIIDPDVLAKKKRESAKDVKQEL